MEIPEENFANISFVNLANYPMAPNAYLQFTHLNGSKTHKSIYLPEHYAEIRMRTEGHCLEKGRKVLLDGLKMDAPLRIGSGMETVKGKIYNAFIGKYPNPPSLHLLLEFPNGDLKECNLTNAADVRNLLNATASRNYNELEKKIIHILTKDEKVSGIIADPNFN